ncbi:MAG: hypothetical protein WC637_14790 [Victivallales bacterium]|jgi:hypothetical protein
MKYFLGILISLLILPQFVEAIGKGQNTGVSGNTELIASLELKQAHTTDEVALIDAVLTVKNVGRQTAIVQSPTNRLSVAFVVLDSLGNLVQPTGRAKVDPPLSSDKTLEPNGEFKHVFEGLKFITGTAQFGYDLKRGERYKVIAIYRPSGADSDGICSKEASIELK